MFKNYFFALALPVGVFMLALGGCGQEAPQNNQSQQEQSPSSEQSSENSQDYSVSDLVSGAEAIGSYKYTATVNTADGENFSQDIWQKGAKMRTEMTREGRKAVYLLDSEAQTAMVYVPSQNMAMKVEYGKAAEQANADQSPKQEAKSLKDYDTTIEGTEMIDGRKCVVVSYSDARSEGIMWLWTKNGLPLKTETTNENGTTVTKIENLEITDIPDSVFELPEGVQVIDASQMMQGQNIPSNMPGM